MQCNDVHVDLDQTWMFLCDCSSSLKGPFRHYWVAQRSWTAQHTREASIPYHASRFPLPKGFSEDPGQHRTRAGSAQTPFVHSMDTGHWKELLALCSLYNHTASTRHHILPVTTRPAHYKDVLTQRNASLPKSNPPLQGCPPFT